MDASILYPEKPAPAAPVVLPADAPAADILYGRPKGEAMSDAAIIAEIMPPVVEPLKQQPVEPAKPAEPERTMKDAAETLYAPPILGFEKVRFDMPAPASIEGYAPATTLPSDLEFADQEQVDSVLRASIRANIGAGAIAAVVPLFVDLHQNPLTSTPESAISELRAEWKDKFDSKLAAIHKFIGDHQELIPVLNIDRRGDDPRVLRWLDAVVQRRQKGRR